MVYEPVLMCWEYFDGPRTGVAECNGSVHYFSCLFDEETSNYSENYKLFPVDGEFVSAARMQNHIFKAWQSKFYNGESATEANPSHRGIDMEYDKLEDWLVNAKKTLVPLSQLMTMETRVLPKQEETVVGILRDLEVQWTLTKNQL